MEVPNIIEGLQIIQKSKPEKESNHHFRAEHDEIFVGDANWKMSEEDKKRLEELGWKADEEHGSWRTFV